MTELIFIRHAHAGDAGTFDGPDSARPLTEKGERQSDRLGRFLANAGLIPDAIISSPKVRATRTAEIVALHLGQAVGIDARLAGAVDLATLEAILAEAGDPVRPILVGHDPDFSELVAELIGATRVPMRKGALARVDIDRPLESGTGTLRWLVPPDLL
jgi:phosphohistidine phosphatase